MRFRSELRARWRGWLVVALLAGIAGGLVLTAAAGARRTHSALARHLVAFHFPDAWVGISNQGVDNTTYKPATRRVHSLPFVEASAVTGVLAYCARDARNRPVGLLGPEAVQFLVNIDGRDGVALHRPKILTGRAPDPRRPREVLVDTRAAQRFGVRPGGVIPIRVFPGFGRGNLAVFHCDPRNQNPAQKGMPELREVRQILLSCQGLRVCGRVKRVIDRLYNRLRGGAGFDRLAKRYSDFPDAKQTGGKLWVERGQTVPAFDGLAFGLRTHELSRPFETRYGWHILEPLSNRVPVGPLIRLRVVGIKAATDPYPIGTVTLTPAFDRAYGLAIRYSDFWIPVKLRHRGADIAALKRATGMDVRAEADDAAKMQESIDHQAQALWLAAGFGALLALLLLAPALGRLTTVAAEAHATLRALGMTRRQLLAVDIARAAVAGAVAAMLAVGLAFTLSPLTPVGLAHELEPTPGFALDPVVLGLGGAGVLLVVVLAGAVASTQVRATPDLPAGRSCGPADALARWGLPPTAVSGVRLALSRGSGTTAVPVAGTLFGAIASVAVVAVALTFTASMDHLLSTPRLYGQNWDYRTNYDVPPPGRVRADAAIGDAAEGTEANILLNGREVHVVAMDDIKGRISPVVVEGQAPGGMDQILLASKVLTALGLHIGDTVEARARRSVRMRIVGRGVLPESVSYQPRPQAAMTFQAYKRLNPSAGVSDFEARIAPGADRQATLARLEREYAHPAPGPPQTIADFAGVRNLPVVVSALLASIAAAVLAYALVTAVRRRRRQLAVLKTLGFDRRQLLATVAWQATTFAAIGLAAGIPLGIAAGRWAWYLFAQQIEVVPEPVTPLPLVLLVIPAAVLLANLVAALPGWSAARTRAAAVLRAE
jgi:ABC-type lipoprotein release transport system permease subunit